MLLNMNIHSIVAVDNGSPKSWLSLWFNRTMVLAVHPEKKQRFSRQFQASSVGTHITFPFGGTYAKRGPN